MAHLLRPEGFTPDPCDICGENSKKHKIHDRDKCQCVHGSAEFLAIVNKELKIARAAVSTGGNSAIIAVASGRLAYTKFMKTPKPGMAKTQAKIGGKTATGLMVAGGAFAVADGILSIIDAAKAKVPQERCSRCNCTYQSAGCILYCTDCKSECIDNNWRKGSADGKCCYNICDNCFERLVGN